MASNSKNSVNFAISIHSGFLVPAAPSFCEAGPPAADAPRDKVLLPLAVLAEVQKEKAEKEQALARAEREHHLAEAAVARAEMLALDFAERTSKAALDSRGGTACFKLCAKHKKPVLCVQSKE